MQHLHNVDNGDNGPDITDSDYEFSRVIPVRCGRYRQCEIFPIFATQNYKSRLTWTDVSHSGAHNEGSNDEPGEGMEGIACINQVILETSLLNFCGTE